MSREALGLIETVGLAAAIEAADTCMKSANVQLVGYELTNGFGMVTVKIKGDVSAVKAAIESAKVSAAAVNTVYATLVIPRPADKLDIMIESKDVIGLKRRVIEEKKIEEEKKIDEKSVMVEEPVMDQESFINEEPVIVVESIIVDGAVQELGYQDNKNKTSDEEICNLCYDPKCTRKKGMTRKLCLHYKDNEGDKV